MVHDDETRALGADEKDGVAYAERQASDLTGDCAGDYALTGVVGRGGGGTVYEGVHRDTGEVCAVKIVHHDFIVRPELLARFQREVETLQQLEHPHVVRVLGTGALADGRPFYAMELLKGESLRELIERQGRLSPEEALGVLEPVCSALTAAHGQGIVHRDLKASNVFSGEGTPPLVKLLDFGIAKLIHPDPDQPGLTTYGTQLGTAHSMAPEQIRCEEIDARADIYALGVMMYHMLTGRYPFYDEDADEVMRSHLTKPPPRPSWVTPVPAPVDRVVVKCLQKEKDDRYQSIEAVLKAFREALEGGGEIEADSTSTSVALYIDAVASDEDADEDEVEDMTMSLVDSATELFEEAEFEVMELGGSVVGFHTLEEDPAEVITKVREIAEKLSEEDLDPVEVRITVHVGEAEMADGELVGGELADFDKWAAHQAPAGLHFTEQAKTQMEAKLAS